MLKFRALRIVSTLYRILAWVFLLVNGLLALAALILGVVQGNKGYPSSVLSTFPGVTQVTGPLSGIMAGVAILIGALILFVLFYAMSELIELGLAIESNTRNMALYLRGEASVPAPPAPISWETPLDQSPLDESPRS